jgi:hypothetical protein
VASSAACSLRRSHRVAEGQRLRVRPTTGSIRGAQRSHGLTIAHLALLEARGSPRVQENATREASQESTCFFRPWSPVLQRTRLTGPVGFG